MPPNAIQNGHSDIAMSISGEKMRVEATGRVPGQIVYLHSVAGKVTASNYNPTEDICSEFNSTFRKLPSDTEKTEIRHSKAFIEVGIIVGDEPEKYLATGSAQDKKRSDARASRGILKRDPKAMRVFVPLTEHINPQGQSKVYIGCRPEEGRLHPRVGSLKTVFFYAEFWEGLPDKTNQDKRLRHVQSKIKWEAATKKTHAPSSTAPIVLSDVEKALSKNPLTTTQLEDLVHKLNWVHRLYRSSRNPESFDTAQQLMRNAEPDLQYGPETPTNAAQAFMDFEKDISEDQARELESELRRLKPAAVLLPATITQKIHQVLRTPDSGGRAYGHGLPYRALGVFLDVCHEELTITLDGSANSTEMAGINSAEIRSVVLQQLRVARKYASWRSTKFLSLGSCEDSPPGDLTTGDGLSKDHQLMLLRGIINGHENALHYKDRLAKELVEHFGAFLQHASPRELSEKLANAIDVSVLKSLTDQYHALIAADFVSRQDSVFDYLKTQMDDLQGLVSAIDVEEEDSGEAENSEDENSEDENSEDEN